MATRTTLQDACREAVVAYNAARQEADRTVLAALVAAGTTFLRLEADHKSAGFDTVKAAREGIVSIVHETLTDPSESRVRNFVSDARAAATIVALVPDFIDLPGANAYAARRLAPVVNRKATKDANVKAIRRTLKSAAEYQAENGGALPAAIVAVRDKAPKRRGSGRAVTVTTPRTLVDHAEGINLAHADPMMIDNVNASDLKRAIGKYAQAYRFLVNADKAYRKAHGLKATEYQTIN